MKSPYLAAHQLTSANNNFQTINIISSNKRLERQPKGAIWGPNGRRYRDVQSSSCTKSFQEKKQERCDSKGKGKQYQDDQFKDQKSYQILMRQSLKRAQTARATNKSKLLEMNKSQTLVLSERKDYFCRDLQEKYQTINTFNELQGVKCVMNSPTIIHPNRRILYNPQSKTNEIKRNKKSEEQLKKNSFNPTSLSQRADRLSLPLDKHMGTAKNASLEVKKIFSQTFSNFNKIAISPTNCVSISPISYESPDNQNNFIRTKRKSKQFTKKVMNLQKEQEFVEINNWEKRTSGHQGNFSPNNMLRIKIGVEGIGHQKQVSKEEQTNISGWEINGGQETQVCF